MTNAQLAILSLVAERPRHGYEIERTIVARNMRDWTEVGFSSIYYVLAKLESAGLVTSRREPAPGRGPKRRVYTTTAAGTAALHEEALQALAGPARRHTNFELALSMLPALDRGRVAAAVKAHRQDLLTRHELLRHRSEGELPFHVATMFDLATTQIEAELEWLHRFDTGFRSRAAQKGRES